MLPHRRRARVPGGPRRRPDVAGSPAPPRRRLRQRAQPLLAYHRCHPDECLAGGEVHPRPVERNGRIEVLACFQRGSARQRMGRPRSRLLDAGPRAGNTSKASTESAERESSGTGMVWLSYRSGRGTSTGRCTLPKGNMMLVGYSYDLLQLGPRLLTTSAIGFGRRPVRVESGRLSSPDNTG